MLAGAQLKPRLAFRRIASACPALKTSYQPLGWTHLNALPKCLCRERRLTLRELGNDCYGVDMKADAYLPVLVRHVPEIQVFDLQGQLLPSLKHYAQQGVVKVIAGPLACHLLIDIKRPYFRPRDRAIDQYTNGAVPFDQWSEE